MSHPSSGLGLFDPARLPLPLPQLPAAAAYLHAPPPHSLLLQTNHHLQPQAHNVQALQQHLQTQQIPTTHTQPPPVTQQQQQPMSAASPAAAAAASTNTHGGASTNSSGGVGPTTSSPSSSKSSSSVGGSGSKGGGGGDGSAPAKKGRKPYTLTKPRESWTPEEHQQFLDALQLYERDWKRIGQHIPTKTIIQIRSHAQKYFIKMAKMGLKEYIPAPSRSKRKQPEEGGEGTAAAGGGGGGSKKGSGSKTKKQKKEEGEEAQDEQVAATAGEGGDASLLASLSGKGEGTSPASSTKKRSHSSRPTPRKPPASSASSATAPEDDNSGATRRSVRKRKQKRKFEDEMYGEDEELEDEEEEEGAMRSRRRTEAYEEEEVMEDAEQQDASESEEMGQGGGEVDSRHQSPATSVPPSPSTSNPSTPLRTGRAAHAAIPGSGLSQLSQLSPLSQLSQATHLDIGAPGLHMLPPTAAGYTAPQPNMKPYPGMAVGRGVAGGQAAAVAPPQLSIPNEGGDGGDAEGGDGEEGDPSALQPEFAKVYSFLGSVFDPSTSGHIEELDKMSGPNKELVQRLMLSLQAKIDPQLQAQQAEAMGVDEGAHQGSIDATGGSGSTSAQGLGTPLLPPPRHLRTSSLGSISSQLDAFSPDVHSSQRWIDPPPSLSPQPSLGHTLPASALGAAAAAASTAALPAGTLHHSPLPLPYSSSSLSNLPRSFSSSGSLSATMSSTAPGSALPPSGAASSSSLPFLDRARPDYASTALASRLTSRPPITPLAVGAMGATPLTVGVAASPTASATAYPTSYAQYAAAMSPSTHVHTPLSFVGSPGGLFSPTGGLPAISSTSIGAPSNSTLGSLSSSAAAAAFTAAGTDAPIHEFPLVKTEAEVKSELGIKSEEDGDKKDKQTGATATTAEGAPMAGGATSAAPVSSTATSSSSSAATSSAASSSTPARSSASSHHPSLVISPNSSHAGNILASLHSSPMPPADHSHPEFPTYSQQQHQQRMKTEQTGAASPPTRA